MGNHRDEFHTDGLGGVVVYRMYYWCECSERVRGCWEWEREDGGHSGSYLARVRFPSSFPSHCIKCARLLMWNTTPYKDLTWRSWFTVYTVRTVYFSLNETWKEFKRNFHCWVGPCLCSLRAPPFLFSLSLCSGRLSNVGWRQGGKNSCKWYNLFNK